MDEKKSIYQNGFFVLKNYIGRMMAASLLLLGLMLFFYLSENVLYLIFGLEFLTPIGNLSVSAASLGMTGGWLILSCLILVPFEMGIKHWFYGVSIGKDLPFISVFYYFSSVKRYFGSLWIWLQLSIRKILWGILFLFPAMILKLTVDYPVQHQNMIVGTIYGMIYALFIVAFFAGVLGVFYYNLKYFLAYYLWFEHPDSSKRALISQSAQIMKDYRKDVLVVYLFMLPLALLCVFIIPILIFIPSFYILTSLQAKKILVQFQNKEV